MRQRKVLAIFGTRPEAIKMAPVIAALKDSASMEVRVCVTAQHRELLDQVLELFAITTDHDLGIMRPDQDLFDLTARLLLGIRSVIEEEQPELVLVQG
ncbi:MAG TPA: UDP-N-acetylglucosamine 2-epimerase, partial [Hyphomicrobiaceae bacterium]|nr:UDP-N-acetylglucosamine 2-epimerase [Hyphomicrobiaceae bacterium]